MYTNHHGIVLPKWPLGYKISSFPIPKPTSEQCGVNAAAAAGREGPVLSSNIWRCRHLEGAAAYTIIRHHGCIHAACTWGILRKGVSREEAVGWINCSGRTDIFQPKSPQAGSEISRAELGGNGEGLRAHGLSASTSPWKCPGCLLDRQSLLWPLSPTAPCNILLARPCFHPPAFYSLWQMETVYTVGPDIFTSYSKGIP